MSRAFAALASVLLAIGCIQFFARQAELPVAPAAQPAPAPAPMPTPTIAPYDPAPRQTAGMPVGGGAIVTRAQYDRLKPGMRRDAAIAILLDPGRETASATDAAGVVTSSRQWANDDGSSILLVFRDDVLTAKSQSGL